MEKYYKIYYYETKKINKNFYRLLNFLIFYYATTLFYIYYLYIIYINYNT